MERKWTNAASGFYSSVLIHESPMAANAYSGMHDGGCRGGVNLPLTIRGVPKW